MDNKVVDVVIVCVVVLVLDIVAGSLGILAQARRNQDCDGVRYKLAGMAASVLFIAAHASANTTGICDCLCPQLKNIRESMCKRKLDFTIASCILSAVYVVGTMLLIAGTYWCGIIHGHAVGIGAILCFVHGGIIIASYIVGYRREARQQQHA